MKKLLKPILLLFFAILTLNGFAYEYFIYGNVTDINSGEGLPEQMINIHLEDSLYSETINLITDYQGNYSVSLEVSNNSFSFVFIEYIDECGFIHNQFVEIFEAGTSEINFISCEEFVPIDDCFADFYYENYFNEVYFFDTSFSPDSIDTWFWEFGDGTTSEEQNPVHSYEEEGEFPVTLKITSENCESTITQFLHFGNDTIIDDCFVDFYYYNEWENPLTVYFECFMPIEIYNSATWDFGDGEISNDFYTSHTYQEFGIYEVTLTVENDFCGIITLPQTVVVEESEPNFCDAYFYYENYYNTVYFYDASFIQDSVTEYYWEFGDGTFSNEQNPVHTFGQEGEYFVTLNISSENCESSFTDFVYTGNDTIWNDCFAEFWYYNDWENPLIVYFENYSFFGDSTLVTWDFGDGETSNDFFPVHTYQEFGVYEVTLTIENEFCGTVSVTSSVFVEEYNFPEECFANFDYFVHDDGFTFEFINTSWMSDAEPFVTWDFGDGNFSYEINPVHTYIAEGEYIVTLNIEDGNCSSSFEMLVWVGENIWYPEYCQALFYPEYNFDNFLTINFVDISYGAGEILAYKWEFGDGAESNLQNPQHIYSEEGEYLVTLTIYTDDCQSAFSEYIYVEDWSWFGDCQAFFFPEFNETLSVQFWDLSIPMPESWAWDFGDGFSSYEQNPIHTFIEPGIYTVTLESSIDSLCSSAFAMEIELYEIDTKDVTYGGKINAAYAINSSPTKVVDLKDKNQISLFPNPVLDNLNININNTFKNAQIQIISISGQIVYSNLFSENNISINITDFASGVYIARINIDGEISNYKFIK